MPLERVKQGYKDVSMSFKSNPLNDDLIGLKNDNAIARSIRNIVFTLPGEKFFDETFGSNISASLFENMDNIAADQIVEEIKQSIDNYEPRVNLLDVVAEPDFDNNTFNVIIIYEIIGADVPPQELQFALQSTR